MAKFRVKLSLEKFHLEIEGSREDIPMITQNVGQQVAGLLTPTAHIVEGEVEEAGNGAAAPVPTQEGNGAAPRRRTGRQRAAGGATRETKTAALDWRHSPEKWGIPRQTWNTQDKCIWLLYVVKEELQIGEIPTTQLVNTFNKHFKQAKQIHRANVHRDLGAAKVGAEAFLGEDTVSNPPRWFLTEKGRKEAERLIAEAKTPAAV